VIQAGEAVASQCIRRVVFLAQELAELVAAVPAAAAVGLGPIRHLVEVNEIELEIADAEFEYFLNERVIAGVVGAGGVAKGGVINDRVPGLIDLLPLAR